MSKQNDSHIVWLDLEMTGLEPAIDEIIEVAMIITDKDLNVVFDGLDLLVKPSQAAVDNMPQKVRDMHEANGLLEAALGSKNTIESVEKKILTKLKLYIPENKGILAGNTIYTDRMFVNRYLPKVDNYLHYRMIDVTSIREIGKRWYPDVPRFEKKASHRAIDDIRESIEELKYWREQIFIPGSDAAK